MDETQKQMLFHEYDELGSYLRTFWSLRAAVLAAGLAFIGFGVSLSAEAKFPHRPIYDFLLLTLVFVISKMLGSLTRSMYLYMDRLREISEELEAPGFWRVWPGYVKRRPMDSGSASYLTILRFLNPCVGVYVLAYHGYLVFFGDSSRGEEIASIAVLVCAVALVWVNHRTVTHELNPVVFIDELYAKWAEASREAANDPDTGRRRPTGCS